MKDTTKRKNTLISSKHRVFNATQSDGDFQTLPAAIPEPERTGKGREQVAKRWIAYPLMFAMEDPLT